MPATFESGRRRQRAGAHQAAVFYPPGGGESRDEKRVRELRAQAICDQCTVVGRWLKYAVDSGEFHGIWGGTNEAERRLMIGA